MTTEMIKKLSHGTSEMISIFKKTHHDTNYDEDGDEVQKVAKKTVATQ